MVSSLAAIQGPPGLVARQTQRCAAAASPKTRSTGIAAVPAFRKHCQQTVPRLPTARACGGEGEPACPPYLVRVHEAADCGDLPALQAALAEMQHPEAEVDQLVTWGGGLPLAPFHRAAAAGRETCLKVLMLAGADRDLLDSQGRAAIHHAAANGAEECVEVLISGGVKMPADLEGNTPLHAAACNGAERCVQQLINSRRVAVDAANSAGTTALQLAAAAPQGSVPCLRALVAAGASVAAVDGSGYTARQVATAAGNTAAALYLTAVEFTARAFPGRPTRSELLGTEGELAAIYQLACEADRAQEKVSAIRAAVQDLAEQQGQAAFFSGKD